MNWNASAVPQISAPLPWSVYVPPAHDVDPAAPVSPTSPFAHGSGRSLKLRMKATLSNVDVLRTDGLWLVTTSPPVIQPSPAYMPAKSGSADPMSVQSNPSDETYPLIVVPEMASFNHTGN